MCGPVVLAVQVARGAAVALEARLKQLGRQGQPAGKAGNNAAVAAAAAVAVAALAVSESAAEEEDAVADVAADTDIAQARVVGRRGM